MMAGRAFAWPAARQTMKTHRTFDFVCQDSGVTLNVRRVPLHYVEDVRLALEEKRPKPPMEEVQMAHGAELRPNPDDPAYEKAIKDFEAQMLAEIMEMYVDRGVVVEANPDGTLVDEDKREELDELRTYYAEKKRDLPAMSDRGLWIRYCAVGSPQDFVELANFISSRSGPTDKAVEQKKGSLPRN